MWWLAAEVECEGCASSQELLEGSHLHYLSPLMSLVAHIRFYNIRLLLLVQHDYNIFYVGCNKI